MGCVEPWRRSRHGRLTYATAGVIIRSPVVVATRMGWVTWTQTNVGLAVCTAVFMGWCAGRSSPLQRTSITPAAAAVSPEPPAPTMQTPAVVQPDPPPQPSTELAASIATFRNERLNECIDIVANPAPGKSLVPEDFDKFVVSLVGDGMPLSKVCAEQFADRKPFATCTVVKGAPPNGSLVLKSHFHNIKAVGEDDQIMRECLKSGGDWQASGDLHDVLATERRRERLEGLLDSLPKR